MGTEIAGPATVIHLHLRRWHHDPLAEIPIEAEEQVDTTTEEILRSIDRSEPLLILNFQRVSEFTGSALTPILKLAMAIKQRSGVLAVCHVPKKIRDTIATTRLDELVKVFDTETEAVEAILLPGNQ